MMRYSHPYGYQRNPDDKNALIVDEEAAEVVRNIYEWFLGGMSKIAIVRSLNDLGILCPSAYKKSKGFKYQNPYANTKSLWGAQTVSEILRHRMYVGDMVQGRYRVKSYKVHIQERVPEDEWFIVENTHEPIIDRTAFEKVQELLKRDTRTAPQQKKLYLFSGFLRCADCGKTMTRSPVKGIVYYFCRTYKDKSKTACTKHTIRDDKLVPAVLYSIQQQVYLAIHYGETLEQINTAPIQKSQSARIFDLIERKEKEVIKLTRYKQALYQDWKDGEVTQSDYKYMRDDYEGQIQALNEAITNLARERKELEQSTPAENRFLVAFQKFENIEKLEREVLIELVDQIRIHEGGNISVKFKFADELKRVMEYVGANTHSEAV